jgi:hypothetical protein
MAGVANSSGHSSAGFHPATAANLTTSDQPSWQAAFYNQTSDNIMVSYDSDPNHALTIVNQNGPIQHTSCSQNPGHCYVNDNNPNAQLRLYLFSSNGTPISSFSGPSLNHMVYNHQCVYITHGSDGYAAGREDFCNDTYGPSK